MTPPQITRGDSETPMVRLQLSPGSVSLFVTIIALLITATIAFAGKTDRNDVKEIVDDKLAPFLVQNRQILESLEEVKAEIRKK